MAQGKPHVEIVVRGDDEVADALGVFVKKLVADLRPGFTALHRFHGQGGVPFAYDRVDVIARREGFGVRGSGL